MNRYGENYRGKNHGNFKTALLITLTKKEEDKKSIWGHSIIEFKEIKSSLKDAIVLVAIAGEIGSQIKAMLVEYGITGVVTIE